MDGEQSDPVPVSSEVRQGSLLDPCLFPFFINDLAQKLDSRVRMLAGATTAYLNVDIQSDAMALQHDLELLAVWERTWQMEFHPDKCQVLGVTNKKSVNNVTHDYILHGQALSVVRSSTLRLTRLTISNGISISTRPYSKLIPPWACSGEMCECHPKP